MFLKRVNLSAVYPIAIGLLALGIVLNFTLFRYAIASDVLKEYDTYRHIIDGGWHLDNSNIFSTALATTLLPATIQKVFHTDIDWTFKLTPVLFLSLLPVVVYLIAINFTSKFLAFVAAIVLQIQPVFLRIPFYAREGIACLFFALLICLCMKRMKRSWLKYSLLILLAIAIPLSHYTTAYVAVFILGVALLLSYALKWHKKVALQFGRYMLVSFCGLIIATIAWNGFIATAPKNYIKYAAISSLNEVIKGTSDNADPMSAYNGQVVNSALIADIWSLDSREEVIQVAFGKTFNSMTWNKKVEFILNWAFILAITVGMFLGLRRLRLHPEWSSLAIASYLLMVLVVLIPNLGRSYGAYRFYFQALIVLSPMAFLMFNKWDNVRLWYNKV